MFDLYKFVLSASKKKSPHIHSESATIYYNPILHRIIKKQRMDGFSFHDFSDHVSTKFQL